jgi:hypothetical protein
LSRPFEQRLGADQGADLLRYDIAGDSLRQRAESSAFAAGED